MDYLVRGLLWDLAFPVIAAFALGTAFRLASTYAKRREWVDKESRLVWTLARGLFTIGLVRRHTGQR